jgi:hypothetical protein
LFNLSSSRQFKGSHKAGIYCWSYHGPIFTADGNYTELGAGEPFNGDNRCCSYANHPGFGIGVDADGNNLLTKRKGEYFTITEIEVWEVTYIVINYINLFLYRTTDREERKRREHSDNNDRSYYFKKLHSLSFLLLL